MLRAGTVKIHQTLGCVQEKTFSLKLEKYQIRDRDFLILTQNFSNGVSNDLM